MAFLILLAHPPCLPQQGNTAHNLDNQQALRNQIIINTERIDRLDREVRDLKNLQVQIAVLDERQMEIQGTLRTIIYLILALGIGFVGRIAYDVLAGRRSP